MSDQFERIVLGALREMEARADATGFPPTELRHEYAGRLLQVVANGYLMVFRSDAQGPVFVPFLGDIFNWAAPNGDTVMSHATLDPAGVYQIVGYRGSSEIATLMVQAGGPALGTIAAGVVSELDLDDVPLDSQGRFEVLLSAERPADHDGAWMTLGDNGATVVTRSIVVAPGQADAAFAIRRLDTAPPGQFVTPDVFWQRAENMMVWARTLTGHIMTAMARKLASPNQDLVYAVQAYGNQTRQYYCEGTYALDEGQALILEARVPRSVRYWSIQVLDALFGAMDFVSHQSGLNGRQIHVDDDGIARIVIAARDPGVANWLDTAGTAAGGIMCRWNDVDHQPAVSAKLVALDALGDHLPGSTKRVSPDERRSILADRALSHQLRRRL